jgi:hypothetical protein
MLPNSDRWFSKIASIEDGVEWPVRPIARIGCCVSVHLVYLQRTKAWARYSACTNIGREVRIALTQHVEEGVKGRLPFGSCPRPCNSLASGA